MAGGMNALNLSKRVSKAESLIEAFMVFENEINYKTAALPEALSAAAKRDKTGIFKIAEENLFEYGATLSFKKAANEGEVCSEEKEVLFSFAEGLSSPDKEGQIKNTRLALVRMEKLMQYAQERKNKLFSLYFTVGILSGAAVGIVLF